MFTHQFKNQWNTLRKWNVSKKEKNVSNSLTSFWTSGVHSHKFTGQSLRWWMDALVLLLQLVPFNCSKCMRILFRWRHKSSLLQTAWASITHSDSRWVAFYWLVFSPVYWCNPVKEFALVLMDDLIDIFNYFMTCSLAWNKQWTVIVTVQ